MGMQSFTRQPEQTPQGKPVVILSCVRLYRNLYNIPFLEQMEKQSQLSVAETLNRALDQLPDFCGIPELECAGMEKNSLLMPGFAPMRFAGQTIRVTDSCAESALINGGDHLVLCKHSPGLALQTLWSRLDELDQALSRVLRFAFHPKYGYLSPDPGNAGTGLEITVILHLPGLALMEEVKPMLTAFRRLDLKCRGIRDTENKFPGNLYVISNRSKMGETEAQLLARMEKTVCRVVEEELDARERLFRQTPMKAEDFCYRSLAVLKHARMISTVEALNALSGLKLAQDRSVAQELIPAGLPCWDHLLLRVLADPAPMSEKEKKEQLPVDRAAFLREAFGGKD